MSHDAASNAELIQVTQSRRAWLRDPWIRLAVFVWFVMTLAVCLRSAYHGERQSVYPVWRGAGHDWRSGHDLYDDGPTRDLVRFGYRYSPLVAGLFTGFDFVPDWLGNILCRLLNGIVFLAAVAWWLQRGVPHETTPTQRGVIYLLMAPVALGSLNNGQMNLLMIGLLLVCLTAVCADRWNLAALSGAGAVVLKIYPISLILLVALVHPRRFLPRLVLALGLLLALPFLMQSPDYVARQYHLWWLRVSHNDVYRRSWALASSYRDIWLLIRVWQLPVSLPQYTALQLAGAGLCAGVALVGRWRLGAGKRLLLVLLVSATAWMLVLGPSPESSTYAILAPALAWWLVQSDAEGLRGAHYAAVFAYGLLLVCVIAGTHSRGIELYHVPGLQPLAVLIFAGGAFTSFVVWCLPGHSRRRLELMQPPAGVRQAA
jgi:hypothetical protein